MTEKLRSLAHPNWPYAGTSYEWRGFVAKNDARNMNTAERKVMERATADLDAEIKTVTS